MKRKRLQRRARTPEERVMPVKKAIDVSELEDGGKLYPSQRAGGSGFIEEEKIKIPEIVDYSGERELPADGLIISPSWMAEAVLDGSKKLLAKTRPFEIENESYLLISARKALGTIELGAMKEVDLKKFKTLSDGHLVNEKVRAEWAKDQESWESGPFYIWPIKRVEKFDKPRKTNIGRGPQVLARDVEVEKQGTLIGTHVYKQIETNPDDLFFFIRLPSDLRESLSKFSEALAKRLKTEVEDVDHITLLYVRGGPGQFTEELADQAWDASTRALKHVAPVRAKIQGWAYFDGASKAGEPKTALVALLDAPGLAEVHVALKEALTRVGVPADDQIHGYVPHATVAYLPKGSRVEGLPAIDGDFEISKAEFAHSKIFEIDFSGSTIEKIRDPETYDPSKVSDAVLLDDHRIVLGWYATRARDPEFKHSLETIELLLRKILKEAVRRGPEVVRFNPKGMKPSVREFWERVAAEIRLPREMLKRLKLVPELDVGKKTTAELLEAHWRLHILHRAERATRLKAGFSVEDISNLHALVVDELFERKTKHPPPAGDGLDDVSEDFERHEEQQPDWDVPPWQKVEKRELAWINSSGVERGDEIVLADVLKHFKTFKTRQPYVYLVGGLANRGKTKGDIDILVKDTEELPENFKHVIHFRLGRALPAELAERLEIHYDNFHGPFTNNIPLYDLTFERINPENEVKLMSDQTEKQEARAASPELRAQAERAEKNDKLTLGEFFYQPKPTRPAFPEELQNIERFISLYRERAEKWLPTFVQKKMDGARHQGHKDGDKIKIISEDGEDNTSRLPQTVEEIRKLKVDKLVFDAEIELWKGRQHLPREAISGYLHAKGEPDDSQVVTNIFDVLYHGKEGDIHKEPVHRRLEFLEKLGIKQSTMGAPDLKFRLNAAPGVKVHDVEELEKAVRRIRELPGSEGVVAKQADSPYPLKVVTPDSWVKLHSASVVHGIVLGREKTKGDVWVYQYGVLPGKTKPEKTVEVEGKTITPVGDTFATKLDFSEGDPILIEGETINIERSPKGERMSVWVPRVIGPGPAKIDTTDSAAARARRNLVLQIKEIDEEGNIEYLPMRAVEKQIDPYMEYPSEDRAPYRYTVSHHHRGRSLHADLRMGTKPKKLLIGWTLNTQIAGSIKEPVTTLTEAKKLAREMDKISKINWKTGVWAERPRARAAKPVRVSILSERKAPEPWAWLDVEGKTKDPEPGKPPPVGGTRKYPGVFNIVDSGEVEIGSNKSWFHEYFVTKGALKGRLIFRQLRIQPAKKGVHSRKQCMHESCKSAPQVDVLWADGRGRAWFCEEHLKAWKQQFKDEGKEDWLDIVGEKKITTGEVPEKWADIHKQIVLPPSEEQGLPGPGWFAIKPDDLTPYVLSGDAVKKDWMPPVGISALPRAIRKQVPAEFRYWTKKTKEAAKTTRDSLVEALKAKTVKLDYEAPYKSEKAEKASLLDARFVLQEQTWRGPIQIRVGPSRTLWHLRLDVGRPELIVVEMYLNPIDNEEVAAQVKDDPHKDSMKLVGPIKPSHYLNPTKNTPSNIEILDTGKASVLSVSDDFIKVRLDGKSLKGLFEAKRSDGDWLWKPSAEGPEVKKGDSMSDEYQAEFKVDIPITKVDKEKRLVTGIVLEPDTIDAQKDTIDAEAIERAAHKFLSKYHRETQLGLLHQQFGKIGVELVESWIAPQNLKMGGESVKKGSWIMTTKVTDDEVWKKVKKGEITGYSIGGVATVV